MVVVNIIDLILNNNHLQTAASHWNRRLLSTAVRKIRRIRTKPKYISVYLAVFMLLFFFSPNYLYWIFSYGRTRVGITHFRCVLPWNTSHRDWDSESRAESLSLKWNMRFSLLLVSIKLTKFFQVFVINTIFKIGRFIFI